MTTDEKLKYCIEQWFETFNDCACCPMFFKCHDDETIDVCSVDCTERIIKWIKENDK